MGRSATGHEAVEIQPVEEEETGGYLQVISKLIATCGLLCFRSAVEQVASSGFSKRDGLHRIYEIVAVICSMSGCPCMWIDREQSGHGAFQRDPLPSIVHVEFERGIIPGICRAFIWAELELIILLLEWPRIPRRPPSWVYSGICPRSRFY